jgi:hypothetical protein
MPSNYQKGKIYKIISDQTNKIYIGSTITTLCRRLGNHRTDMLYDKIVSSREILKYGDARIILIENFPCNNREELVAREQYWIDLNKDICVNKHSAYTGILISQLDDPTGYKQELRKIKEVCIYCDKYITRQYRPIHNKSKKHKDNIKLCHSFLDESDEE